MFGYFIRVSVFAISTSLPIYVIARGCVTNHSNSVYRGVSSREQLFD